MAADPYQPCPCGIPKKIKFCCGADVLEDLGKIEQAISGEQRLGALDLCNRLLAQKPDRPCLLMNKALVQLQLEEHDAAAETVKHLLEVSPHNPAGHALAAILACHHLDVDTAVQSLQTALEEAQGQLVTPVYEALGVVSQALELVEEPLPARAYAVLQATASQGRDQMAVYRLLGLSTMRHVPLAAVGKSDFTALPPPQNLSPADAQQFDAAQQLVLLGCWRAGAQAYAALAERFPHSPLAWQNLAACRLRILDEDGAIAALRRLAALPGIPRDDAIEAEALAIYLAGPGPIDMVPEVTVTYAVTDSAQLREQFLSNKRLQSVPVPRPEGETPNEPPPLAAYLLLDRPIPATGQNLSRDTVPRLLGTLLLYGKETDRPARLEFVTLKMADYESRLKHLTEVGGPLLAEKLSEEETGRASAVAANLSINWRLPDDTPTEVRKRLVQEQRTLGLLSIWPNLPMGALDGRSPRQVVADPQGQIRVLALILTMDLEESDENPDYNKLRRSLGLPTLEPIDPTTVDLDRLSPAQLARLEVAKLTDDKLVSVYRRALIYATPRLMKPLALEVAARPKLDNHPQLDKTEVYDLLSRLVSDPDDILKNLLKAQEAAKAKGRSPARYLLQELPIRLARGEGQESRRILNLLMTRHAGEPGIQQALGNMLNELGLIRVDPDTGRPVIAIPSAGPSPAAVSEPAAAAPSGLWTPEAAAPAAAASEGKSKLWLPGEG
jgi:tetratricopeptide (TPR) repeat protein